MNNKKITSLFQIMALVSGLGDEYLNFDFDYIKYEMDQEIINCQLKLYILMLIDDEKEQEKRFKEFEESYKELSKDKQEYIKLEFKKILQEQDKISKEKEKRL